MEFGHAQTITSASLLKTYPQAAPVKQFPENHDIFEQSASQAES
jgi:hypothetical protein